MFANIRSGCGRSTWPAEIGPRLGQGDAGGRGRWEDGRFRSRRCRARAKIALRILTKKDPEALADHAALLCACDGPGRDAAVRGGAIGVWTDDRERLLLRHADAASADARRIFRRSRRRWPRSSRRTSRSSGSTSRATRHWRSAASWGRHSRSSTSRRAWPTRRALSFYRQGEFIDLCRGPHVPSGRGDRGVQAAHRGRGLLERRPSRQQLQRLYGTAWFSKEDLENYLKTVEEAKRRDHRVLGKQLELFAISPLVGSGLILWLPQGGGGPRAAGKLCPRGADQTRLRARLHAAHRPDRLYKISGHYPVLRRQPVQADRDERRRAAICSSR